MTKVELHTPFFVFNPKSYLYGEELLELVEVAEEIAKEQEISIFVTAPFADLSSISQKASHVIVTAQHMDGIEPGRGMGHVLPESLVAAGAKAVFLNHAEHPMTISELTKAIKRAKELDIITIACADSILEAQAIAMLNPEILLCEPTELIGTGQTSSEEYIRQTNEAIKKVQPDMLVMQAAGISTADDVYRTLSLGADGTGATSGITEADDPKQALTDMIMAAVKTLEE